MIRRFAPTLISEQSVSEPDRHLPAGRVLFMNEENFVMLHKIPVDSHISKANPLISSRKTGAAYKKTLICK